WTTYTLGTSLYTTCGNPADKYEFGYNGQMKTNEIAGIGNHNSALFWEYSPQIGRRWNLDPKPNDSVSSYAAFCNNPIRYSDIKGDTPRNSTNTQVPNSQQSHYPAPKNGLPGFPDAGKGAYNPKSQRWRWKDKNGDILEWDKQHGEVE